MSDDDEGFTYEVSDEMLQRFARSTLSQRIQWLDEMRVFSWTMASPETRERWRRVRESKRRMSEPLNALERAVLDKILDGDHPVLEILRTQAAATRVADRKHTGVGFYCNFEVPDGLPRVAGRIPFGDVNATIPGLAHGAGFVLFLRDGMLDFLEGYTFGEPWPREISGFVLRYDVDPRPSSFEKLRRDAGPELPDRGVARADQKPS